MGQKYGMLQLYEIFTYVALFSKLDCWTEMRLFYEQFTVETGMRLSR